MFLGRLSIIVALGMTSLISGNRIVKAQQELGFAEKFALATDRREALSELIPGTNDFYYYSCLHLQNQKQLAESEAVIEQWRAKFGQTPQINGMLTRQVLLAYDQNPERALEYLKQNLNLNFDHAPPARDHAASLNTELDSSAIAPEQLLASAIAQDPNFGQVEASGLHLLLDRQLSPEQMRSVLGRLPRADLPKTVQLIAKELGLRDTQGFGWAAVHRLQTLEQLDTLLALRPELLENNKFFLAYTAQLAPAEGTSLADPRVMRDYLVRLLDWSRKLPASQNSFKALVIGNLLRLDLSENQYDRALFLEYLQLPRNASYYDLSRFGSRQPTLAELGFRIDAQASLPPIGDDSSLVRRFLEHFLQSEDDVDDYAKYLKREYLEQVLAETKILYGIGDASVWYSKLSPNDQRLLSERAEVRFAPHNQSFYLPDDEVRLDVEIKNVPELIVKIYEINTAAYFREQTKQIGTDIDLDGLVANAERRITFAQPGQRRHVEQIRLPELSGRGVWVVDLLGAGQRSRALIRKGNLLAVERLGDAGHVFSVVDQDGRSVDTASIELGGQEFTSKNGQIIIPYGESLATRRIVIVDGTFASTQLIAHHAEKYELTAGFLLDRQSIVSGTQATVIVRPRLSCNGQPISVQILQDPQLRITATDTDGLTTSQVVEGVELEDGDELVHSFLVPQRLRNLSFALTGSVYNRNRSEKQPVSVNHSVTCNGIVDSSQIADFFFQRTASGYRLLVLGRNGEPISRLPVSLTVKPKYFANTHSFGLATDAEGVIQLGRLETIESVRVSAQGIRESEFRPHPFHRSWPQELNLQAGNQLSLQLGKETSELAQFSLFEVRRRVQHQSYVSKLSIEKGALHIAPLNEGNYVLTDHESGQSVLIAVSDGERRGQFLIGRNRILQTGQRVEICVRDAIVDGEDLVVRIANADPQTRVHIVGNVFESDTAPAKSLQISMPSLQTVSRASNRSDYVDSLLLDEEYRYILERRGLAQYPGNMLPQPSLLIHPWEVSVTENNRVEAKAGDALPPSPAADAPMARQKRSAAGEGAQADPSWKSYDFLADSSAVLANVGLVEGEVRIPVADFAGYSTVTVVAVHPTSLDSREVVLGHENFLPRDQRLRTSFDPLKQLVQTQRVEFLRAGEAKSLGDPNTRRLQTYSSIADVFQLYGTLLENSTEWEKFRFLTRWHHLEQAERLRHYNEMACHELNFFLYHKDREFFDSVVKPILQNKMEKQLVDRWLLGESLEQYNHLWIIQNLNTLERILLAERIENRREGTIRWLKDHLVAFPMAAQERQQRFETALRGTSLESRASGEQMKYYSGRETILGEELSRFSRGGTAGASGVQRGATMPPDARSLRRMRESSADKNGPEADAVASDFFGVDRPELALEQASPGFFRSLDKTREWAESNYFRIRTAEQGSELVAPSAFWAEFLEADASQPFTPKALDLACENLNEALLALAVVDLPFDGEAPEAKIENDTLVLTAKSASIVYLESIDENESSNQAQTVLIGQDIYLESQNETQPRRPIRSAMLRGVPYQASVVVTNPTSDHMRVQVLTQLPAGSIPLAGSKTTRSTPLELSPYSTAQVRYTFYFPEAGDFAHYGAQASSELDQIGRNASEVDPSEARSVASAASGQLQVREEPESVDETTWEHVADWGTNAQVLEYLEQNNLLNIDLSRIAFRMKDREFYDAALAILTAAGNFEPRLWAYSVLHGDKEGIEQLAHNREDLVSQLGWVLDSPVLQLDPAIQLSIEHLDYRPLVVARSHRLGQKHVILNPSLGTQYTRLLDRLSHQSEITPEQRLQVCYYMLLQNRITEALEWFDGTDASRLQMRLQYDYLDAYLDFYRGNYDRAAEIARRYEGFLSPRWNELFSQIRRQVSEREAISARTILENDWDADRKEETDPSQRKLTDQRSRQLASQAIQSPAITVSVQADSAEIRYQNLKSVQVSYYVMDIELLFSRRPFVSQGEDKAPVIQPNFTEEIELAGGSGTKILRLPDQLKNSNVLIDVSGGGISRRAVVTNSALNVTVSEPYGQLRVLNLKSRGPVEGAYVKVYARHQDGAERFFKDGYTDLRGQFDYASLSTGDLDSAQRFSILVLDEELGASVHEAAPPTR